MKSSKIPTATAIQLSDAERSTLVWALEIARALRLGDPDVRVLLADPSIRVELLDELADRLVLAGQPETGREE